MTTATEARPIGAWMGMLDRIEESVARRLAQAEELAAPSAAPETQPSTPLKALDDRLAQMQSRLEQAEADAREADEALRIEAEAYQRWTAAMAAARRGLADRAARLGKRDEKNPYSPDDADAGEGPHAAPA